jgi:hypothetical protein
MAVAILDFSDDARALRRKTHQTIAKITSDFEGLPYDPAGNQLTEKTFQGQDASNTLLSDVAYSYDESNRIFETNTSLFPINNPVVTPDGPLTASDGLVTARFVFDMNGRMDERVDDNQVSTT